MIYQNSRYYNQLIDFVSFTKDGNANPILFYEFDVLGSVTWWSHTYQEGERLDSIAYKYYKRSDYWWLIPEYNPTIDDFANIVPGTVLRIPRV
jgi:nucleoid-associated protein YgaU